MKAIVTIQTSAFMDVPNFLRPYILGVKSFEDMPQEMVEMYEEWFDKFNFDIFLGNMIGYEITDIEPKE